MRARTLPHVNSVHGSRCQSKIKKVKHFRKEERACHEEEGHWHLRAQGSFAGVGIVVYLSGGSKADFLQLSCWGNARQSAGRSQCMLQACPGRDKEHWSYYEIFWQTWTEKMVDTLVA